MLSKAEDPVLNTEETTGGGNLLSFKNNYHAYLSVLTYFVVDVMCRQVASDTWQLSSTVQLL